MTQPSYFDYNNVPNLAAAIKVVPTIIYPVQETFKSTQDRILRFDIKKENAFWDPLSAYIKATISLGGGTGTTTLQTPGNFKYDIQSSKLEYLKSWNTINSSVDMINTFPKTEGNQPIIPNTNNTSYISDGTNHFPSTMQNYPKSTDTFLQSDRGWCTLFSTLLIKSYNDDVERVENADVVLSWLEDMKTTNCDRQTKAHLGFNDTLNLEADYSTVNTGFYSSTSSSLYPYLMGGSRINLLKGSQGTASNLTRNVGNNNVNPEFAGQLYHSAAFESLLFAVPATINRIAELSKNLCYYVPSNSNGVTYLASTGTNTDGAPNDITGGVASMYSGLDSNFAYSTVFSGGSNEMILSNLPVYGIVNGLPGSASISSYDILLPLNSSFLGQLMPLDKYKMFPLHTIENLTLELRQNPDAFFTSYYGENQRDRLISLDKIEMHVNLITFDDDSFNNQIINSIISGGGIQIPTCTWRFCNSFDIQEGNIQKEYIINSGFTSLKMLVLGFHSCDYEKASCYRKSCRLSHNVQSLQVRFGNRYFPSLPIKGNGGTNVGSPNNDEFYWSLLGAFGKRLDSSGILINKSNFCLDERGVYFDSSNFALVNTFLNTEPPQASTAADGALMNLLALNSSILGTDANNVTFNRYSSNATTDAMKAQLIFKTCGNSQGINFYENQIQGKALYAVDFDEANYMEGQMGGVDTTATKPWNILITANSQFTRKSRLYVFGYIGVTISIVGTRLVVSGIN